MTQQKETLNEFINRRMAELGLKSKVLTDAGIGAWTFKKIREKPYALSESDFQKIAYALQCSIGDLKARVPASVRKDAGHEMDLLAKENGAPSVMETVAKLEAMVEEEYPELGSSADNVHVSEENAQNSNENVQKPEQNVQDQEENAQEPAEPITGTLDFNCIENAKPKRKTKKINQTDIIAPRVQVIKSVADEVKAITVEEYRQQLKDMCLQQFLIYGRPAQVETVYAAIGEKLVKELLGK